MSDLDTFINVASDFSPYPAGRDEGDGPNNGAKFRTQLLLPSFERAKANGGKLIVSLAGLRSFGSSFLEEAFGGLVRAGVSKKELAKYLVLEPGSPDNKRYLEAIDRYIAKARIDLT